MAEAQLSNKGQAICGIVTAMACVYVMANKVRSEPELFKDVGIMAPLVLGGIFSGAMRVFEKACRNLNLNQQTQEQLLVMAFGGPHG